MQINNDLNLVFPMQHKDGETLIWAYHSPISTEVFRANYRILVATNAEIWQKGSAHAGAHANVANLVLLDAAASDAAERGILDTGKAFLAEIRRLTYILAPGSNGFEMLPIDAAIARGIIDADDWNEAEALIVFFTSGSSILNREARKGRCRLIASAIGGSITSLPPLEWVASLPQSTPDVSSEAALS